MSQSLWDLSNTASLPDIREFLRLLGWLPIDHPNRRLQVFRKADGSSPIEFVLPQTSDVMDFANRVAETAQTLAVILNSTPDLVLTKIREIGEDVLRARLVSDASIGGSIPLYLAANFVSSMKNLLSYAATAETSPLPFFDRPARKAIAHTQRCRFGHTFAGSFAFTIESPLAPAIQEQLLRGAAPPFERRVMERLYRGISNLQEATETQDLAPIVRNYETGLSANMCDALLKITQDVTDLKVLFEVAWSPKVPEDTTMQRGPLVMGPDSIEYLESARKELRGSGSAEPATIEGRVVLCKSDSPPWEDEPDDPHTVVIASFSGEGKAIRINAVLSPEDYVSACRAHISGHSVQASGTLVQRGKYSRLLNVHKFQAGPQFEMRDPSE